jgi:hypothetical protein
MKLLHRNINCVAALLLAGLLPSSLATAADQLLERPPHRKFTSFKVGSHHAASGITGKSNPTELTLTISFAAEDPRIEAEMPIVRYEQVGIKVWDAAGKELPCRPLKEPSHVFELAGTRGVSAMGHYVVSDRGMKPARVRVS